MIGKISYLYLAMFLVCLVVSCGEKDTFDADEEACPIEFSVVNYTAEVKGNELTSSTIVNFGVFSLMENSTTVSTSLFMDNVEVVKSSSGTSWCATPSYYWPILPDKTLTFYAYAPYNEEASSSSMVYVGEEGIGQWNMKIHHTVPQDPSSHLDLCIARNLEGKTKDDSGEPVELNFSHTLSSVTFAANYIGSPPEGCVLRIRELSLSNIMSSGTLTVTPDASVWSDLSTPNTIKMTKYNQTLHDVDVPERDDGNSNHMTFVTTKGEAYLIPQIINSNASESVLSLTVSYLQDGVTEIAQFSTQMIMPTSELLASKKTKYVFTINLDTVSLVEITPAAIIPWESSGNFHGEQIIK